MVADVLDCDRSIRALVVLADDAKIHRRLRAADFHHLAIEGVRNEDVAHSICHHALWCVSGVYKGLGAAAGRNLQDTVVGDGIRDEDIARGIHPHAFRCSYANRLHRRLNATGSDFDYQVAIGIRDEDIARCIHRHSKRSAQAGGGHHALDAARRQLHHTGDRGIRDEEIACSIHRHIIRITQSVDGHCDLASCRSAAGRNLYHRGASVVHDEQIACSIDGHACGRVEPAGRHRGLNSTGRQFYDLIVCIIRDEEVARPIERQFGRFIQSGDWQYGLRAWTKRNRRSLANAVDGLGCQHIPAAIQKPNSAHAQTRRGRSKVDIHVAAVAWAHSAGAGARCALREVEAGCALRDDLN